ncbi:glycosyltransferase family 87 protein [Mucilaginibacter sp.]|uniref:glycosyltransferase family 87 protein n=1 Tax=Mucilaginibacter sp. TaxID=1882438 RepID=UPI00284E6371|nr:glycosyltransferase family 87 protein [Mucilaginibacter sp.]MDR3694889.1 glycosyltransferase family 87 protein [Mucilaginibacter sp.]
MSKLAKLVYNKPFVLTLYFGLSIFAVVKSVILHHIHNNYFVYKFGFVNTIHLHTVFGPQPEHYTDLYHYGPIFALLMAPFALLPDSLGVILWVLFNAWALYIAIKLLPLKNQYYLPILLICAHELMTSTSNVEINPLIGALIILSFVFIRDKKDFWAALMICLGTFIKLYGVVGLAFFFFSDNKFKFILSMLFWSVVLFLLPMLISSPSYIVQTYHDWYGDLVRKNISNIGPSLQDVSLMGLIRNIFNYRQLSNIAVIIPGILLFAAWYARIKYYKVLPYQLLLLASTLIFVIIFSSSSESPTYIIAFAGVAIWFMNLDRPVTRLELSLFIFALLLTSFSPSDLFPHYIRVTYVIPYKLKALPCVLIWLKIIYETVTRKFNTETQRKDASLL